MAAETSPDPAPSLDFGGRAPDPFDPLIEGWRHGRIERRAIEGDELGRTLRTDGGAPFELRVYRATLEGRAIGVEVEIPLAGAAPVYGSGESFLSLDLRGHRRVVLDRETHGASGVDIAYLNVPFFWSTGWGMLLDTGAPVLADLGASDRARARLLVLASKVDVVFFAGTPASIIARYTARTGRVGDWPDWAFGTWMSRASYLSAGELHGVVDECEAADCPIDVVHVDAWTTGNVFRELTCNWTVDRARFPEGWTDALRARGVRTSVWLNPYVLAGSPLGEALRRDGMLVVDRAGDPVATPDRLDRHLIDFTNPAAVAWWQRAVRRLLDEERPDALKLDFGEEVPPDARFHDGRCGTELRNGYAALYHRATAAAIPPDRAPMPFFCRSGSVGSQRLPCHWVGDTPSTWEGLGGALTACLSLSLTGFALVSHDAGGFYTSKRQALVPTTLLDGGEAEFSADVDPELYGRWAQWAALTPVTRFHGVGRREPTAYPEPWRSAAIAALRLRRRLLPVLRAALDEARATGLPLMRPMPLVAPDDTDARAAVAQYLLGADVLVAPVLAPGGGARVWCPDDDAWIPLLGAAPLAGKGWHDVVVAPHEFPVWARRGSTAARLQE